MNNRLKQLNKKIDKDKTIKGNRGKRLKIFLQNKQKQNKTYETFVFFTTFHATTVEELIKKISLRLQYKVKNFQFILDEETSYSALVEVLIFEEQIIQQREIERFSSSITKSIFNEIKKCKIPAKNKIT